MNIQPGIRAQGGESMTTWAPIEADRYYEMLYVLPPIAHRACGFLVGEPHDHTRAGLPRFVAFLEHEQDFFESTSPLTVADWLAVNPATIVITEGGMA